MQSTRRWNGLERELFLPALTAEHTFWAMEHNDAEITDVLVVLDGKGEESVNTAMKQLKDIGMEVSDVNNDEGVVEGSIATDRLSQLKSVPGVAYVRTVFSYVADYPPGDPRNQDANDEEIEDE